MRDIPNNFLPSIYVNEKIKQALLLQLISNEPLNILLLGDPYTGKSSILRATAALKERASYFNGTIFSSSIAAQHVFVKEKLEQTEKIIN